LRDEQPRERHIRLDPNAARWVVEHERQQAAAKAGAGAEAQARENAAEPKMEARAGAGQGRGSLGRGRGRGAEPMEVPSESKVTSEGTDMEKQLLRFRQRAKLQDLAEYVVFWEGGSQESNTCGEINEIIWRPRDTR